MSPRFFSCGQVSGALRSIELYTKQPERGEIYPTAARDRLFVSDRKVCVLLRWGVPKPGSYGEKVGLRMPTGFIYSEREHRFATTQSRWITAHSFNLPHGAEAQLLTGTWHVEAPLDGTVVGDRTFTFDPSSIRLQTAARIVILQGTDDPELAIGDWHWSDRFGALENVKAAHAILGIVLRDEFARRYPTVAGPQPEPPQPPATSRCSCGPS